MVRRHLLIVVALCACAEPEAPAPPASLREVRVVWHQGWEGETWDRARAGLWWTLSSLGASPPADERGLHLISVRDDEVVFDLDFDALGLPAGHEVAIDLALAPVWGSDEMALNGAVDLGRLLMATAYQPWVYAALAGVCPTYEDFAAARLGEGTASYLVTDSLLVEGERLLTMRQTPTAPAEIAFVAAEGEGSVLEGDFEVLEREVVDVMDNGQQRFAVYDLRGDLLPAATVSPAGQSGKCLWCHENHVMPIMTSNTPAPGHLDFAEVSAVIALAQSLIDEARAADDSAVDYQTYEVHAWSELLVETFLFAPPARIAREWRVDEAQVRAHLDDAGLVGAPHEEYPEFGLLYARADIDALFEQLAPALTGVEAYTSLDVLRSARDLSAADAEALPYGSLLDDLVPCAP